MKFILTADLHLRGDRPRCRLDENWIETQRKALAFIVAQANSRGLGIFMAGDIFNTPRVATEVLNMAISELVKCEHGIRVLAGNHDLPYHSYDLRHQSCYGVLAQMFPELNTFGLWNAQPFGMDNGENERELAFSHQLVFPNAKARPMACQDLGRTAEEVLKQFPHAKIVCVGDYHHKFIHTSEDGRRVINPGCMLRQVADMKDYRPSFYIVDTATAEIETVEIPDVYELVTEEYLREAEAKSDSINAFVEAVRTGTAVKLDFRANLEARLLECPEDVRTLIATLTQETFNESL